MKHIIRILSIVAVLAGVFPAHAVTDKEMDQARAIAAQCYLRYANDGSGYLDEVNPTSMADLEKVLKQKEKENIKAFKAIPVPKDFPSWDKAKLVEYWTATAFSTKGLIEKGRGGKSRARKKINALSISAPSATAEAASAAPAPEASPAPANEAPAAPVATPSASDSVVPQVQLDPLSDDSLFVDEEAEVKKESNNTWIYIVILCILVGVVVALVVFASNVMKKSAGGRQSSGADVDAIRAKFEKVLKEKDAEIARQAKEIESLESENGTLRERMERLEAELSSLRSRSAVASSPAREPSAALRPAAASKEQSARQDASRLRTIYLGRANSKGIFVRADRVLNPGNSVFRLDTTDGYAGTFRVASDPSVWELGLDNPVEVLSGACLCADIDDTAGMERIVCDSAGTAIFEGGCWRVIRKAKIHFE